MTMRFKSFGMWGNTIYKQPTPGPYCCNPSTNADFSGNTNSIIINMGLLPDNNLFIQGYQLGKYSGASISNAIVIDSCGNLVKSLSPTISDGNNCNYTVQSNGNLIQAVQQYVVGWTNTYNYNSSFYSGGTVPNTNIRFNGITTMASDKLLTVVTSIATGYSYTVTGTTYSGFTNFMLLNSNGIPDTTYKPTSAFSLGTPILFKDSNSKVLVGCISNFTGTTYNGLIRLNTDGTLDSTFSGVTTNLAPFAIAQQSTGKYLIGGGFTNYKGNSGQTYLIRLNTDGTLDTTFKYALPDGSPSGYVKNIFVLPDDKILIGDESTTFYRFNPNGTIDTSFWDSTNTIAGGSTYDEKAIATDSDGNIWVGGVFLTWNGYTTGKLVKLYNNGVLNNCNTITPTPTPTPTSVTPTPTPSITPTNTTTPTPTPSSNLTYSADIYATRSGTGTDSYIWYSLDGSTYTQVSTTLVSTSCVSVGTISNIPSGATLYLQAGTAAQASTYYTRGIIGANNCTFVPTPTACVYTTTISGNTSISLKYINTSC